MRLLGFIVGVVIYFPAAIIRAVFGAIGDAARNVYAAAPSALAVWIFCLRHPIRGFKLIRVAQGMMRVEEEMETEREAMEVERLDRLRNPHKYRKR